MAYFVWQTDILESMTKKGHRKFLPLKSNFFGKLPGEIEIFMKFAWAKNRNF